MKAIEEAVWATLRAFGPAAGSIAGGYAGAVLGPTIITSIVTALGISTSGAGFVAAVIIPASPAIGKAVGSALGSGLLSFQINLLYELRMQRFRPHKKTAGQIIKDVGRKSFTDAAVGAVSLGGGSAAAAAVTEATVKQMLTELVKRASLKLAGDVFVSAIGKRARARYPMPTVPFTGLPADTPTPGAPAPSAPSGTAADAGPDNTPSHPRGPTTGGDTGEGGASSGAEDPGDADDDSELSTPVDPGAGSAREHAVPADAPPATEPFTPPEPPADPGNGDPSPGYNRTLASAARLGLISGMIGDVAGAIPRILPTGVGARTVVIQQFWIAAGRPDVRAVIETAPAKE